MKNVTELKTNKAVYHQNWCFGDVWFSQNSDKILFDENQIKRNFKKFKTNKLMLLKIVSFPFLSKLTEDRHCYEKSEQTFPMRASLLRQTAADVYIISV